MKALLTSVILALTVVSAVPVAVQLPVEAACQRRRGSERPCPTRDRCNDGNSRTCSGRGRFIPANQICGIYDMLGLPCPRR